MADSNLDDQIAQLQAQQTLGAQPSFGGVSAPPSPDLIAALLDKLRQQQMFERLTAPTQSSDPYAYLHDAGKVQAASLGQNLGNLANQVIQGVGSRGSQMNDGTNPNVNTGGLGSSAGSTSSNFSPNVMGKNATSTPSGDPIPAGGLQRNAILAAKKVAADSIAAGDDPLVAQAKGFKVLSQAGFDVSDQLAKIGEAMKKQQTQDAEAAKNNAEAANYPRQDARETLKDTREEKQNTWTTVKETNDTVIQKNGLGEIRAVQKTPATLQAAAASDSVDPTSALSPSKEIIAQRIARGDMAMIPSRSKDASAINARALSINPDLTGATFPTRAKALAAVTSGKQGDQIRSFNVAYNHLDTVNDAIDALQSGDIRTFNGIANRIATETGQPQPTNLDTAMSMVKGELAKAIVGSRPAEGEVDKMLAGVTSANGPAELRGAVNTAKELMLGQAAGIKRQFNPSVTGGAYNFEDALSPSFRRDLSAYEAKSAAKDTKGSAAAKTPTPSASPPLTNSKGWQLVRDAKGNMAYMGPGGKYEEVKP